MGTDNRGNRSLAKDIRDILTLFWMFVVLIPYSVVWVFCIIFGLLFSGVGENLYMLVDWIKRRKGK